MKLNQISYIEALVFTACQSQTKDKSLYYIHNQSDNPILLSELIYKAEEEVHNSSHLHAAYHTFEKALITLRPVLEKDVAFNSGIILKIKQIWWRLWGFDYCQKMNNLLRDKKEALNTVQNLTTPLLLNIKAPEGTCHCYLSALSQFMGEFEGLFGTTPSALKGGEICKFFLIAKRIWRSTNVQENQDSYEKKYDAFKHLMEEYVIGSHMVFEESIEGNKLKGVLALEILSHIGIEPKKGRIQPRISSHYRHEGSRKQHQIEGSMFPAWLFDHAHLGYDTLSEKIATRNGQATYYDHLCQDMKKKHEKRLFTWGQNENTPFNSSPLSFLKHTIDTLRYFALKHVCRSKRPQIAAYTSKKIGRGKPDTDPVIVKKIHPQTPNINLHSHRPLKLSQVYLAL